MNLLGFRFAPRLKSLKNMRLYSFKKISHYKEKGHQILPHGYINVNLLRENWDEILRFVATIKLKETTASQLFKRLNSYSKQHIVYKALKELGRIYKTLFILDYIDDVHLRQAIEKQLNKVESSNRFSKAISFGNNQEFTDGETEAMEVSEGCRRLIKNAIVCWNYLYLSQAIIREGSLDKKRAILSSIRDGSIALWRHVNLHWEYDFSDDQRKDSIGFELPKILDVNVAKFLGIENDVSIQH